MQLSEIKWKDYHLYDLFEIDTGNKFDRSKMTSIDPTVNFVGRSSTKNGVTAYVDYVDGVTPYDEGCLTIALGGEHIGSCFVQNHPFYTSQNVVVLTPKEPMSENVKIFISHVVRNESKNNYMAFARELNSHIKTDFAIKIPVIVDGTPDYIFMEEYIEGLKSDCSSIPDYFLDEGFDRAFWYLDNIDQANDKILIESIFAKANLSEREEYVIKARNGFYGKVYTLAEIGEKFGVTRERIRQIEIKAMSKLKKTLEKKYHVKPKDSQEFFEKNHYVLGLSRSIY